MYKIGVILEGCSLKREFKRMAYRFFAFLIICLGVLFVCPLNSIAQKNKKKEVNTAQVLPEEIENGIKNGSIIIPMLDFPNIHKTPYFFNKEALSLINKYKREKDWPRLLPVLKQYVNQFGMQNFTQDIGLMWDLARLAEHEGEMQLSREVYRLLLKHHRGSVEIPKNLVDTLDTADKKSYASIETYFEKIDRWNLVDTLRPKESNDMGEAINSEYEEYGLTIGGNDSIIVFTSNRLKEGKTSKISELNEKPDENLYIAYRTESEDEDEEWSQVYALSSLNSEYNEGSPAISKDGTKIVFARCYEPGGQGNCDLYFSERINDTTWSDPINLGKGVNSYAWESHPAFSLSGDTLFFVSDRRGGFGGSDIYFCLHSKDLKRWSDAYNLGPHINTRNNEVSPFIHPENGLLYFSSDGHLNNFGSYDIFKSYPYKKTWSEPKNIGPFVNGPGSEFYFSIDKTAEKIFYAKSKDKDQNLDLFTFPLPMEAQAGALIKFSGKIFEETTEETFEGEIAIFDLDEKVPIAPKKIGPDGTFEFMLQNKKNYLLVVSGENFFRMEQVFFLNGDTKIDIPVKSIKAIEFKSIEFESGSSKLLPQMENDLHLLIQFLGDHPEFTLSIEGHTDSSGNAESNKKLSQDRSDVIRNFLLSYGELEASRVQSIGYGSSRPLVTPEKTEEDKALNRRVEFHFSKEEKSEKKEDTSESDSDDGW